MKESNIQSQIISYLQILEKQGKLFFQRINNTAIYDPVGKRWRSLAKGTKKGFPDILVLKDSRCIGLEVKTSKGKQSKEQEEMESLMKEHGAAYYVVRSLEEVINIVEKIN
ncbi:VRR-NUC domain-containing protein [Fusobacterium ulcerans]|uniref:VRR-NUC domain-containing protein n=1 Tax=Fusobacterium ulcerans TaxID=861 RepID=UPI001D0B4BDF|nr:VRR-NUC domain-containing protein [Fusobacterium ulcerans]MCB8563885.1 VRR-NUC domain-containing protein [Fusobacterium ulcerans]MCB8648275.1 VRR-NUC domain-containing protein [Fusobacterium ulcerans]